MKIFLTVVYLFLAGITAKNVNLIYNATYYEFCKYATKIADQHTYVYVYDMTTCRCRFIYSYRLCSCDGFTVLNMATEHTFSCANQLMQLVGNNLLQPDYAHNRVCLINDIFQPQLDHPPRLGDLDGFMPAVIINLVLRPMSPHRQHKRIVWLIPTNVKVT